MSGTLRIPWQNWAPKSLNSLRHYRRDLLLSDLIAGESVQLEIRG